MSAPAGGGLAEVLAVLDAARQGTADPHDLYCARLAIAELIAADKEYDAARAEYDAKAPSGLGEPDSRTDEDYERLRAAKARRRAALAKVASNGDTK